MGTGTVTSISGYIMQVINAQAGGFSKGYGASEFVEAAGTDCILTKSEFEKSAGYLTGYRYDEFSLKYANEELKKATKEGNKAKIEELTLEVKNEENERKVISGLYDKYISEASKKYGDSNLKGLPFNDFKAFLEKLATTDEQFGKDYEKQLKNLEIQRKQKLEQEKQRIAKQKAEERIALDKKMNPFLYSCLSTPVKSVVTTTSTQPMVVPTPTKKLVTPTPTKK